MLQPTSILYLLSISSLAYAQLIVPRMIGGEQTNIRNFPYQISLQINDSQHICGGGIIGKRFVLTAAHCVVDGRLHLRNSQFKVVAGTTNLNKFREDLAVEVEKIYILKSYRPIELANDVAVLRLKKDIVSSRGLSILQLPNYHWNYVGRTAQIAGYGWNWLQNWRHGTSDHTLRYLNVKIISNEKCRRQFSIFDPRDIMKRIHDSNICGQAVSQRYGEVAGVCKGDSGSPLVIGNTVIGIASRAGSTNCTEDALAARYTRVSSFVEFVNNVLYGFQSDDIQTYDLTVGEESAYVIFFPKDKK